MQARAVELGRHLDLIEQLQVPAVRADERVRLGAHNDVTVWAVRLRRELEVVHADSVCRWPKRG